MTLAEVTRRYRLSARQVRRLVDAGWIIDGVLYKLDASRVGRSWDVTQESLEKWATAYDAAVLAQVLAFMQRAGRDWLQLDWSCPDHYRHSLDRAVARGQLRYEHVQCKDSGIRWHTYFRLDAP